MYSLYMTYYIMDKLNTVLIMLVLVSVAIIAVAAIVWLSSYISFDTAYSETEKNRLRALCTTARRTTFAFLATAVVFGMVSTVVPDGKESINFAAARFADEYIQKHPNTALSPTRAVEGIDHGVSDIANIVDRLSKISDKALTLLEKKVDTAAGH